MADAGRVLLMPKGTYSASTNYEVLDWVRYSNGTYASKHNNNQGNTPTGNPTDPHWALLCQDGSGGGSNVSWTQLVTSGTKIATIEIDGVQTDVYAPSGGGGSYSAGTGISISNNTISIDPGTITSGNQKPVTGDTVNTALSNKADISSIPDGLADLTDDVNISSPSNDQVLKYDGSSSKWVNGSAPASGHTMLPDPTSTPAPDEDDVVNAVNGVLGGVNPGANNNVPSLFGLGTWSNTDTMTLLTTVAQGDDAVGTWEDDATWESGSRAYWLKHTALHGILSDDDVEISLVFDVADGEAISCLAYRVDDAITSSLGGIAIKFNAPVQNASGATVGVVLKRNRTNTETVPRTS